MKHINILFVLSFLFIAQVSFAQNNFKIGTSMLIHGGDFELLTMPLGGEVSYEVGLNDHFSVNFAGNIHYAEQKSGFLQNRIKKIKRKDLLIGSQIDVRYYFKGLYQGAYIGIGGDAKHLTAKNYFTTEMDGDINGTLSDYEYNVGITYGTYIPLQYGTLNPNIYVGGNPTDQNEYVVHAKVGINYVF